MTAADAEALAEAYNDGLAREKQGDIAGAVAAYKRALALDPADPGGVTIRLAALGQGRAPERAPAAYVATLFDQTAEAFDGMLVEQLGYAVPMMIREVLEKHGVTPAARLLDLGCGTGLTGESLADWAGHSTGVDLSEGMIEIADEKEVYDALYIGDAEGFLVAAEGETWDLISATDVVPYLGGLDGFMNAIAARLSPGGHVVFSTETLADAALAGRDYMVGAKHRFAHGAGYLRRLLADAGLTVISFEDIVVRYDAGIPVPGHLVLARRGAGQDGLEKKK